MSKQVFQTDSRRRWMRFKWTMRFFATLIALLLIVFVIMFFMEGSPGMPFRHDYRGVMSASKPLMRDTKLSKTYRSLRDNILEQHMHNTYQEQYDKRHRFVGHGLGLTQKYINEWSDPRMGVRAAWYVNWDRHSRRSLQQNMKHLNMVIPEWLFINPKTCKLETQIDKKALEQEPDAHDLLEVSESEYIKVTEPKAN